MNKKAKLISGGGFSKIINVKKYTKVLIIPFFSKFTMTSTELWGISVPLFFEAKFQLEKITKRYAIYRQFDVIKIDD